MTTSEPEVALARMEMAAAAEAMLRGAVSYIEGSRIICSLMHDAGVDVLAEPFVAFVSISSQTEIVPIGKVREQWSAEARLSHACDWERAEQFAQKALEAECRELAAEFSGDKF